MLDANSISEGKLPMSKNYSRKWLKTDKKAKNGLLFFKLKLVVNLCYNKRHSDKTGTLCVCGFKTHIQSTSFDLQEKYFRVLIQHLRRDIANEMGA